MDFNILLPGHAKLLHSLPSVVVSVAEPVHGEPPFDAGIASTLVRVVVPPPHVAEHVDQSPYSPHTQSTTASTYENKCAKNNNIAIKTYKDTNIKFL